MLTKNCSRGLWYRAEERNQSSNPSQSPTATITVPSASDPEWNVDMHLNLNPNHSGKSTLPTHKISCYDGRFAVFGIVINVDMARRLVVTQCCLWDGCLPRVSCTGSLQWNPMSGASEWCYGKCSLMENSLFMKCPTTRYINITVFIKNKTLKTNFCEKCKIKLFDLILEVWNTDGHDTPKA